MDIENIIRQIVREEITAALNELKREISHNEYKELPLVLTVQQAAKVMRIGITKAYEMTRRADFPKIKDGGKIIVPRDALIRWLNENAGKIGMPHL